MKGAEFARPMPNRSGTNWIAEKTTRNTLKLNTLAVHSSRPHEKSEASRSSSLWITVMHWEA